MASYAFLSLWFREFSIEKGVSHLETLLGLFPASAQRPGFRLVVRSLSPAESPSLEADMLVAQADVRVAASEFLHNDTAYEVTAHWDRWQPRGGNDWEQAPVMAEFVLQGEEFDNARYRELGHLQVNLGPEHLYLGLPDRAPDTSFRYARENVRCLYAFMRPREKQLPLSGQRLWAEGEPDFANRTEQILGR
jgi:hypothetical protein